LKSLLTNPAVIEMDQHSVGSGQTEQTGDMVVWTSKSSPGGRDYLAVFNLGDAPLHVDRTIAQFGYLERAQYKVRDLWQRKELGVLNSIQVDLPAHGSVVYSLHE
jgi:alpha-galactosidase